MNNERKRVANNLQWPQLFCGEVFAIWAVKGDQPVWLSQSESHTGIIIEYCSVNIRCMNRSSLFSNYVSYFCGETGLHISDIQSFGFIIGNPECNDGEKVCRRRKKGGQENFHGVPCKIWS